VILIDAGPVVAIVSPNDQHHTVCIKALQQIDMPLGTVWPVLAEALHLLRVVPGTQDAGLRKLLEDTVRLLPLDLSNVPRNRELMHKYSDRPMDLADAALVRVAERENIRHFFTVDHDDFAVTGCTEEFVP
jgi:uncharacterized protein